MNWLPNTLLFFAAWLAVFAQTQFAPVAGLLGAPLCIVPALVVYAALTSNIAVMTGLVLFAGMAIDSLSANRVGVSLPPLFVVGFLVHARQHLILRDQVYAQVWLGIGAGWAVPLGTQTLLSMVRPEPISGWPTLWHLVFGAALNGAMCPLCFVLFGRLRDAFDYRPVVESSFRPDRQIKRGRS